MKNKKLIRSRRKLMVRFLTVFWSTFLFVFTVIFLRKYGYIGDLGLDKIMAEPKMREDTNIGITDIDIKNQILIESDNKLFSYNYLEGQKTELISQEMVSKSGILDDGRIYFWKNNGNVFNELYLQKGKMLEKIKLPLNKKENAMAVAGDGNWMAFLSSRDSSGNYKKNDLFIYDLNSFKTGKISSSEFLNIERMLISPNSNLIAFTYNYIRPGMKNTETMLGVVMDRKTMNLFEKIKIKENFLFSRDSKKIIFDGENGVTVLDLETGKIISELLEAKLIDGDGEVFLLAVTQEEEEVSDDKLERLCEQRSNKEYGFYEIEADGLKLGKRLENQNILKIEGSGIFNFQLNQIIGTFLDWESCEEDQQIWDFTNNQFFDLGFSNNRVYFAP